MANLVIAHALLGDAATVSASSAEATLPASNVQTRQPGIVWRATDRDAEWLTWDLGAATTVSLAALVNTNLSAAGTWRIRAATSEANLTAAPGYDSGTMTDPSSPRGLRTRVWHYFGPRSYRWWRIDLADPTGPDAAIEVGRAILADAWQPSHNYQRGIGQGIIDPSARTVTRGGQSYVDAVGIRETLDGIQIVGMPDDEAITRARAMMRTVGNSRPVFVGLNPEDTVHRAARSMYGLPRWDQVRLQFHEHHTVTLQVEELTA